jgi:hypothetical protein
MKRMNKQNEPIINLSQAAPAAKYDDYTEESETDDDIELTETQKTKPPKHQNLEKNL